LGQKNKKNNAGNMDRGSGTCNRQYDYTLYTGGKITKDDLWTTVPRVILSS